MIWHDAVPMEFRAAPTGGFDQCFFDRLSGLVHQHGPATYNVARYHDRQVRVQIALFVQAVRMATPGFRLLGSSSAVALHGTPPSQHIFMEDPNRDSFSLGGPARSEVGPLRPCRSPRSNDRGPTSPLAPLNDSGRSRLVRPLQRRTAFAPDPPATEDPDYCVPSSASSSSSDQPSISSRGLRRLG